LRSIRWRFIRARDEPAEPAARREVRCSPENPGHSVGPSKMSYLYLAIAIVCELAATGMLKKTDGFRRLWPTVAAIVGYACGYGALALALRGMPVGIAYALWTGIGVIAMPIIGWRYYHQRIDRFAVVGMALILSGVLVINLLSEQA
jgi:small multidrug resistance pump